MTDRLLQKDALLNLLKKYSYKIGKYTLSSGQQSSYFLDCKSTLLQSDGIFLAAKVIIDIIEYSKMEPNGVAGVSLGGCPLATGVSILNHSLGNRRIDALYIRKEPKDHGTEKLVEGQLLQGKNVILLEDVLTTGGSAIKALQTLCKYGYNPIAVITIIDRREGGQDNIQQAFKNMPVISLYTIGDFQDV
jgi:orotate phosphoribosyltransferase